jgi:predicted transcriptional regulator YdeE
VIPDVGGRTGIASLSAGNLEGALAPRFENGRAMLIAGVVGRYGNENRAQIPDLWQRFGPRYFGRVPGLVDKKAYGVRSMTTQSTL